MRNKMRQISFLYPLLTAYLAVAVAGAKQQPFAEQPLGPAMPPQGNPSSSSPFDGSDKESVILSDVLGNDRSINIFAGFTRDFANISKRFEDASLNTTILAPLNSAIMGLPRKPWEDPDQYDKLGVNAYEGQDGEERAHKNMRRFVQAHVIPTSPWKEGEKLSTLAGGQVWWETRNGIKMIQPGNIEVGSIANRVFNGEVWILKGVRNYA